MEQMTIFDFMRNPAEDFERAFDIFHEHCKMRGWHKPATETEPSVWMCGKDAKCWEDWRPCKAENCPLREGK